jgi:DNA-binding transcriptional regulator YiaG
MKCTECGNVMNKSIGEHRYVESGLKNVTLRGVTKYSCESCGAERINLPSIGPMHRAIAKAIAEKPARLSPDEVAFLRDHLELSNRDFAELMGVTPEQASRWTSSDPIGVPAERFLRLISVLGAEGLARRNAESLRGAIAASENEDKLNLFDTMVEVIGHLPSRSEPVRDVGIDLRKSGAFWKTEQSN